MVENRNTSEATVISPPPSLLLKELHFSPILKVPELNPPNLVIETVTNYFLRMPSLQLQPCSMWRGQDIKLYT